MAKITVAIINYGMGNLKSVYNALKFLKVKPIIVDTPSKLKADKIIIPGVGAFEDGIRNIKPFIPKIMKSITSGIPILGICLGFQIFFEKSEESPRIAGLGIMKGKVERIRTNLKLPHIGWNSITVDKKNSILFKDVENGYVYFVHSYHPIPEQDITVASTQYGSKITAAVEKSNIFGVQFHPEKSGKTGLQILKNFLES
ncbi:MAG: imidazole glycerol phosphate synthase subunit HisH [Candidatus Bathyarchaeia archaeon]